MNTLHRLQAGDLIRYAGQPCRVLRVNDCCAVVAVTKMPATRQQSGAVVRMHH